MDCLSIELDTFESHDGKMLIKSEGFGNATSRMTSNDAQSREGKFPIGEFLKQTLRFGLVV